MPATETLETFSFLFLSVSEGHDRLELISSSCLNALFVVRPVGKMNLNEGSI